jgi:hypothetical protein
MLSRYNHITLFLLIPLLVLESSNGLNSLFTNNNFLESGLREPSPVIVITAPLVNSVARPTLYIKVKAISNTDSIRLTIYNQATVLGNYYDSIDNYLDLSNYEGMQINLTIKATDRNNQVTTSNPIPIFVESSHKLKEIYQASDRILDVNYNKLLVTDQSGYSHPRIIDIRDGATENIDYPDSIIMGYLTAFGAIVESRFNGKSSLYESKSGKIIYLGKFQEGSLKVAGNYCIWEVSYQKDIYTIEDTVFLRNIEAEQTTIVTTQGDSNSDIAENGIVVYIDSASVFKYDKGTTSRITQTGPGYDASPLTDGVNIAYYERFSPFDAAYLQKPTGNRFSLWNGIRGIAPRPYLNYQVNNKYCAYVDMPIKNVISSSLFVWELRILDTLGNSILLDSLPRYLLMTLDLLSPKADVMYFRPYRTLALFNGDTIRISSALGKTYYRDSSWYIAIGRSLFKVDLHPGQDMVNNSTLYIGKDSAHSFSVSEFTNHFEGPGQLVKIKFTVLPVKGTVKKAGIAVGINDEINISDINSLSYTPNAGYTGNDSLRWNAYDGFSYTSANALMSLQIQAKPEQPVLIGLSDSYCNTAGQQKINIANYPDVSNGYTVNVSMDSNNLPVTSADSSFSFNPNAYQPGNHMIKTVFTNIAGSTIDIAYIFIKSEETPIVRVSSNITNVTDLTLPVTITATNYEGGGSSPLYSFAKNNSFTDILQSEGTNNKLVMNPSTLSIGNNWVFIRMKTSETCYSVKVAIDSINITRDAVTGIIDPETPGKVITVNPNPFRNTIFIGGLNPAKKYTFSLYPVTGQSVYTRKTSGSSNITIGETRIAAGFYFLTIFDASKGRMLGTIKLLKE